MDPVFIKLKSNNDFRSKNQLNMKIGRKTFKTIICFSSLLSLFFIYQCTSQKDKTIKKNSTVGEEYYVAAYIWPSCHDEEMSHEVLWPEGIGEWEIIKKGTPRFEGHYQPKIPLWGYEMDDDPKVMENGLMLPPAME